jgi:Tfp pilus assembly protein PilV
MKKFQISQAGDTIVEVVIAVAIVSTILAGAFTVTNRSTIAVRDSEEHAQALQLLQGQVELLRHMASISSASLPNSLSVPFCLTTGGFYQPAATSSQCLLSSLYRVVISSPTSSPSVGTTTTFNLTATWTAIRGGINTVYLSYKVVVAP